MTTAALGMLIHGALALTALTPIVLLALLLLDCKRGQLW